MTIIERARLCMATRPAAIEGENGNSTTYSVAALLVWGFGLDPSEALGLMLEYNARCEPPWSQRDLQRMLASVPQRAHDKARGYMVADEHAVKGDAVEVAAEEPRRKRKRVHDLEALKRVQDASLPQTMQSWRLWLRERSPLDPAGVSAEQYLDGLYEPGEKVLIFLNMRTMGDFGRVIGKQTYKIGKLPDIPPEPCQLPQGSPEGMTFLMQPVDGKWYPKLGRNERPELSRRTKRSVTRWPFILLESDKVPLEMWLNAMVRARLRIVSITSSGGRSLHALLRADKETEQELLEELQDRDALETLAVLGCDAQAMHGVVYPRLPNTWREGKQMAKLDGQGQRIRDKVGRVVMHFVPFREGRARQSLLYYNPRPAVGVSIAEGVRFAHGEA